MKKAIITAIAVLCALTACSNSAGNSSPADKAGDSSHKSEAEITAVQDSVTVQTSSNTVSNVESESGLSESSTADSETLSENHEEIQYEPFSGDVYMRSEDNKVLTDVGDDIIQEVCVHNEHTDYKHAFLVNYYISTELMAKIMNTEVNVTDGVISFSVNHLNVEISDGVLRAQDDILGEHPSMNSHRCDIVEYNKKIYVNANGVMSYIWEDGIGREDVYDKHYHYVYKRFMLGVSDRFPDSDRFYVYMYEYDREKEPLSVIDADPLYINYKGNYLYDKDGVYYIEKGDGLYYPLVEVQVTDNTTICGAIPIIRGDDLS